MSNGNPVILYNMTEKEKQGWRNGISTQVYNNKFFRSYAAKICPRLVEEILSELSISILSMKFDSLIKYHAQGCLNAYCTTIINNMVRNPKSPLNKMYSVNYVPIETALNVTNDNIMPDSFISEDSLILIEDIKEFLNKRSLSLPEESEQNELFDMAFLQSETYEDCTNSTSKGKTTVYNSIEETRKLIDTKFKKQYNDIRNK